MRHGWRSSIVIRQAVASTLVMLVAIALLALAARITVMREQRRALLATIDTDIAGLADGMIAGGAAEVARRIADRTAFLGSAQASYRLADARGKRVAGDLDDRVALDATRSQNGDIATPQGRALGRATRLRDGYTLVVARSLAPAEAVVGRLTRLFVLGAIPAAIVSLAAGALVARRFGARVAVLNHVFGRFAGGDRAARSALAGDPDELGMLAGHVDAHLARTEKLIEAQREISDNIAHELRTPLGHLDTRLLRALETSDAEVVRNELHDARDDIRAIVSLFDALLDIALAESGGSASGEATSFDLSERIAELADLYAASAEEAGLAFSSRIAPSVTMRGEPMAMTRLVANLLDNAFKFTGPGNHVRLTLRPGPRIEVEDDGPGIDAADRDRMFQRFQGSRAAGKGHGLGLALVRVIAARHGLGTRFEDAAPGCRFIIAPEGSDEAA